MSKMEGVQFLFFGCSATAALMLFASTDEGGGDFDSLLQILSGVYVLSALTLIILLLYQYVFAPLLCPFRNTAADNKGKDDHNNIEDHRASNETFNTSSFNISSNFS